MKKYLSEKKDVNLLLFVAVFLYIMITFGRLAYKVNATNVLSDFGVNNASHGEVLTWFAVCYGIGQFVNGVTLGKLPSDKLVFYAVIVSSVFTVALPLLPFESFKFIWALNGIVQSCLWCNIVQLLADMVPAESMPKVVFGLSFTTPIGTLIAYGFSALFTALDCWTVVFFVSAGFMLLSAFMWKGTLVKMKKLTVSEETETVEKQPLSFLANFDWIKALPLIAFTIGTVSIGAHVIKSLPGDWMSVILKDTFGYENALAIVLSLFSAMALVLGSGLAKILYDKLKNPMTSCGVVYIAYSLTLLMMFFFSEVNVVLTICMFMILSICACGIGNTTTSVVPMALRRHGSSGAISGILDACCYLGDAVSAGVIGLITSGKTDVLGAWKDVYLVMLIISVAMTVLSFITVPSWKKRVGTGGGY